MEHEIKGLTFKFGIQCCSKSCLEAPFWDLRPACFTHLMQWRSEILYLFASSQRTKKLWGAVTKSGSRDKRSTHWLGLPWWNIDKLAEIDEFVRHCGLNTDVCMNRTQRGSRTLIVTGHFLVWLWGNNAPCLLTFFRKRKHILFTRRAYQ